MSKALSREQKQELLSLLEEKARRRRYRLIDELFPDSGPYARERYQKHLEFFRAGATHRERLFMAANRSGKSVAGGAELTYHLTGRYPHWWEGKRFDHPIRGLAAGDTTQTTRDIIQNKLLGGLYDTPEFGTGLIPIDYLGKPTPSRGRGNPRRLSGRLAALANRTLTGHQNPARVQIWTGAPSADGKIRSKR